MLFAQLWRGRVDEDDDGDDQPDIWISPVAWDATQEPVALAERIARFTGCPVPDVLKAMAEPVTGSLDCTPAVPFPGI